MNTTTENQKRGVVTERIKKMSQRVFGYEISAPELRLLPYLQYTLVNSQRLKPEHLNTEDREILARYVKKGYILNGVTPNGRPMMSEGERFRVSKKFWHYMLELIWLGYADLDQ